MGAPRTVAGRALAAAGLAAAVLGAGAATSSAATLTAGPPRTAAVAITTSCFTATGPDGVRQAIYGKRFTLGTPTPDTPAIVLVHGVGSTADTWDFTPRWSVARWLASQGYVVIAYDRLGYRHSAYAGDPAGLTVSAQQSVLHDVIGEVHAGSYTVGGTACGTGASTTPTSYASRRVAIIGHSGGGFIVSSYPGRYHDVVAMVQANAPSGLMSYDPPGNAAIVSQSGPKAHGAMDDRFGPIGDPSADGPAAPAQDGYSYGELGSRAGCEEFNLLRATAVKAVATVMCNPANAVPTPTAEGGSYVQQAVENNTIIPRTGKIPVLLAGGDHDGVMPGDANALELSAWKGSCGCDVQQFVLKDTAHAFMAHSTLTDWTSRVVTWLRAKTITAATPTGVKAGVFPPVACGPVTATATLGAAGRRARTITVSSGGHARRLPGHRRTLRVVLPYRGTDTAIVTVRARSASGATLGTVTRAVGHCRAVT